MRAPDTADSNGMDFQPESPEFWRYFLAARIPRLYQMFYRHGLHTALCEELVQATVLDAVRGLNTYDPQRGKPEQWLFGIANHVLAKEIHRRQSELKCNRQWLDYIRSIDRRILPDELLEQQENVTHIRQSICSLDALEQEVLFARYHEDLSIRQISQQMSLTEKAVESLLYRAKNMLKIKLQEIRPLAKEIVP